MITFSYERKKCGQHNDIQISIKKKSCPSGGFLVTYAKYCSFCLAWFGSVWLSVAWCGLVWLGVALCGLVLLGVAWCGSVLLGVA